MESVLATLWCLPGPAVSDALAGGSEEAGASTARREDDGRAEDDGDEDEMERSCRVA